MCDLLQITECSQAQPLYYTPRSSLLASSAIKPCELCCSAAIAIAIAISSILTIHYSHCQTKIRRQNAPIPALFSTSQTGRYRSRVDCTTNDAKTEVSLSLLLHSSLYTSAIQNGKQAPSVAAVNSGWCSRNCEAAGLGDQQLRKTLVRQRPCDHSG